MKIIHIFDHSLPIQDGYSTRSWSILQQQVALGWDVLPVTGPRQHSEKDDIQVVSGMAFYRTSCAKSIWEKIPVFRQLWTIKLIYSRLVSLISTCFPDVIHAHSPALNGVAAYFAARRFSLPMVYEVRAFWEDAAVDQGTSTENGWRYRLTRAMENFVLRRAEKVTVICEGLRHDIESRRLNLLPVKVIPNSVDYDLLSIPLLRDEQLAISYELALGKTIGFVGSFYEYEGLDLLVRAMPELIKNDPDIRLLLVGGGIHEVSLRADVAKLGISRNVIFAGRIPFDQVGRFYSVIDVLAYPRKSLRLTELVTPLKPLEAMAQNKVFVASDVGGHRELVTDGETGVLFKAGDVNALVDAIKALMKDLVLQSRLRNNGSAFVREQRNWRTTINLYLQVYEEAIELAKKKIE